MPTYGTTDRCTGGAATASNEGGTDADNAFDNNNTTYYFYADCGSEWIKYDFGAGVTWKISKIVIRGLNDTDGVKIKDFTVAGSNNDSSYTTLYTGQNPNDENDNTYTFTNKIAYRYIKITVTTCWGANLRTGIREISMYEGIYPINGWSSGSNPMIF